MRPDQVPQAAVDAAAVEVGRALSPFYDRPTTEDALITRRVVAAAAPHLIDDAVDTLREWIAGEQRRCAPRRMFVLDRLSALLDDLTTGDDDARD